MKLQNVKKYMDRMAKIINKLIEKNKFSTIYGLIGLALLLFWYFLNYLDFEWVEQVLRYVAYIYVLVSSLICFSHLRNLFLKDKRKEILVFKSIKNKVVFILQSVFCTTIFVFFLLDFDEDILFVFFPLGYSFISLAESIAYMENKKKHLIIKGIKEVRIIPKNEILSLVLNEYLKCITTSGEEIIVVKMKGIIKNQAEDLSEFLKKIRSELKI